VHPQRLPRELPGAPSRRSSGRAAEGGRSKRALPERCSSDALRAMAARPPTIAPRPCSGVSRAARSRASSPTYARACARGRGSSALNADAAAALPFRQRERSHKSPAVSGVSRDAGRRGRASASAAIESGLVVFRGAARDGETRSAPPRSARPEFPLRRRRGRMNPAPRARARGAGCTSFTRPQGPACDARAGVHRSTAPRDCRRRRGARQLI
jgi:hypothetical protein